MAIIERSFPEYVYTKRDEKNKEELAKGTREIPIIAIPKYPFRNEMESSGQLSITFSSGKWTFLRL